MIFQKRFQQNWSPSCCGNNDRKTPCWTKSWCISNSERLERLQAWNIWRIGKVLLNSTLQLSQNLWPICVFKSMGF